MKLGKLQKAWAKSLRENPKRQESNRLGRGTEENYTACCLGELRMCAYRMFGGDFPFVDGVIMDHKDVGDFLETSYQDCGLISPRGVLSKSFKDERLQKTFYSLADMNDEGYTWSEIADYIENNPENVFVKSV